jgi:hypothetical protein
MWMACSVRVGLRRLVMPWRMASVFRASGKQPGLMISMRSANTIRRMEALVK